MATFNALAKRTAIDLFVSTYAAASLVIYEGATVLVTHTLAGFNAATGEGIVTASAVTDSEVAESGTADSAKLIADGNEITLSVGLIGSEVNMSTLQLVAGGASTINGITLTAMAS